MRRVVVTVVIGGLFASMAVIGTASAASAGVASIQKARLFTATGTMGRYYTKQTVTGVYKNAKGRLLDVTIYNWQGQILVFKHLPKLDPTYEGGYWHDTYGVDQWYVGQNAEAVFHFMLPPAPMGSTFAALLITDFKVGGNWQNWMDGTSR